jgi:hypothetical protein
VTDCGELAWPLSYRECVAQWRGSHDLPPLLQRQMPEEHLRMPRPYKRRLGGAAQSAHQQSSGDVGEENTHAAPGE